MSDSIIKQIQKSAFAKDPVFTEKQLAYIQEMKYLNDIYLDSVLYYPKDLSENFDQISPAYGLVSSAYLKVSEANYKLFSPVESLGTKRLQTMSDKIFASKLMPVTDRTAFRLLLPKALIPKALVLHPEIFTGIPHHVVQEARIHIYNKAPILKGRE